MRKTKTIAVERLRNKANHFFLVTKNELQPERRAIASFIEGVLMDTGNYKGFRYLEKTEMLPGFSYGIERGTENKFPDDTRVSYF